MTKKKELHHNKESLIVRMILAILPAAAAAIAAGIVGYKLNVHMPELYYDLAPKPVNTARGFRLNTTIVNLGNSAANDLVIRYSFDRPILYFSYNYSEGLEGKLPSENISGGAGSKELILTPRRLIPDDKVEAYFVFAYPDVDRTIKVFSKETKGRSLTDREQNLSKGKELWRKATMGMQNLWYRITGGAPEIKDLEEK